MKKIWPYILIILLILPIARYLFGPGYFNMHDDLQVMRIFQMEKCFADGQIPCRWSPDMAWGYGQAMFNFYSALPYYLGVLIRIISPFSIMATVKLLFFISLAGSAIGMYLLAKEFWGKLGGIVAAILYAYAPYHALDIFVRGALAEAFALAILPFLWLSLYHLIKKPDYIKLALASLSLAALLTTHNVSTLMYAPFTAFWVVFWLIIQKSKKSIIYVFFAGLLGLGLSSFFLLPVLIEQSLIQKDVLIVEYYDYRAHFVNLRQLFLDRSWGDGPSIFGPYDDISFQIGWPHWWLGIILFLVGVRKFVHQKKKTRSILLLGLLGLSGLTAFLTHSRSTPIWQAIPIISFVQFPWRFLGLTIFFISFAGGAIVSNQFKSKFKKLFAATTILLAIVLNQRYFIPINFSSKVNDEQKLTGLAFELQQKSAILDYLPKTAPIAPEAVAFKEPSLISGEGEIIGFTKRSNRFSFEANIHQDAEVEIPVMYFPGWAAVVDKQPVPIQIHGDYGLISVKVSSGQHDVRGIFQNTPIRTAGNVLTVLSSAILFSGLVIKANKKRL